MNGKVGDRLVIKRLSTGAPNRDGEILEVHGVDGAPPYLVQWSDDGEVGLLFPDAEAHIEHIARSKTSTTSDDASTSDKQ